MKLTKYNHACFSVEKDGQIIVVDPGNFSGDFIAPEGVVAIIITHQHPDHFDHDQIAAIVDKNPETIIVAHQSIAEQIEVFQTKPVASNDDIEIGSYRLRFYGGTHATIHSSIATIANLGVLINELIYYPGDSFHIPAVPVDTLALPVAAPWMKLSEAIDFALEVRPRLVFPTHDAILSESGKIVVDRIVGEFAGQNSIDYQRLDDSITI